MKYSPDSYDREEGVAILTDIFSNTYNREGEEAILTNIFTRHLE